MFNAHVLWLSLNVKRSTLNQGKTLNIKPFQSSLLLCLFFQQVADFAEQHFLLRGFGSRCSGSSSGGSGLLGSLLLGVHLGDGADDEEDGEGDDEEVNHCLDEVAIIEGSLSDFLAGLGSVSRLDDPAQGMGF